MFVLSAWCFTVLLLLWLGNGQACAYIRDNGESSKIKSKRRKGIMKDGRKFGKRFAQQGEVVVRGDSPIEVKQYASCFTIPVTSSV